MFQFFISADCCEAKRLTDSRKLSTLIRPELFQFLLSFCTYLLKTHNSKNISKVHGSIYFYGVGKKCPWQMFFSFSKIKVLLRHHYQVIHRYENLRCSISSIYVYFCYIIICIFMYIQIWCIITVFQISCNAQKLNKIWWYKQLFFKLCFRAKYNLKPKMYIVVIWLSSLFFFFTFQCFSSFLRCFLHSTP